MSIPKKKLITYFLSKCLGIFTINYIQFKQNGEVEMSQDEI